MAATANRVQYRLNQHKCFLNAAVAELQLRQLPHADFPFGREGVGALLSQRVMPYAKFEPIVDIELWYKANNRGTYGDFFIDPPIYKPIEPIVCAMCTGTCSDMKYPIEVCASFKVFDDTSDFKPKLVHVCEHCVSVASDTYFETCARQEFAMDAANLRMRRKQFKIAALDTYANFQRRFFEDIENRDRVRAAKKREAEREKAEKAAATKKRKAEEAKAAKKTKKAKVDPAAAAARRKAEREAEEARVAAEAKRRRAAERAEAAREKAAAEQAKREQREQEVQHGKDVIYAAWRMTKTQGHAYIGQRVSAERILKRLIAKFADLLRFDLETGIFTVL